MAHAKAIAFALVSLGQKLKMQKTCEIHSTRRLELFCLKKPLEKTSNIRKMKRF